MQIVADQVLQPGLTLSTISPLTFRSLADAVRYNLKSEGSFLNHLLNVGCIFSHILLGIFSHSGGLISKLSQGTSFVFWAP